MLTSPTRICSGLLHVSTSPTSFMATAWRVTLTRGSLANSPPTQPSFWTRLPPQFSMLSEGLLLDSLEVHERFLRASRPRVCSQSIPSLLHRRYKPDRFR